MIRPLLAAAAAALLSVHSLPAFAANPHPDLTQFDIPTVTMVKDGFGLQLAQACEQIGKYKAPAPGAPAGPAAAAAPPPPFTATEADLARDVITTPGVATAKQAAAADAEAMNLKEICTSITASNVSDAQLNVLREVLKSGTLPSLTKAIANGAKDGPELAAKMKTSGGPLQGAVSDVVSGVTGIESPLFSGLANLLVTRSKEEAILYLQERLGTELCEKQRLKEILPNTCALVQNVDTALSIAAMGAALNAAAKRDLRDLPEGLLKLGEQQDVANFYAYEGLRLVYAMILKMEGGRAPLEVVQSVHALPARACESASNTHAADLTCQHLMRGVRLGSALLYAGQANALVKQQADLGTQPVLVVGTLLDAEALAGSATPAATAFKFQAAHLGGLLKALKTVSSVWKDFDHRTQPLLRASPDNADPLERRRQLASIATDTVKKVAELTIELMPYLNATAAQQADVEKAMSLVAATSSLASSILLEQFGGAILDGQVLATKLKALSPPPALERALTNAQKVLPLIAEIASAKSSADVSTALEAAAAPASSYRAKYQRGVLAIGGLVGVLGGWEKPNDPHNQAVLGKAKGSPFVGGFAPVGLQGSYPISENFHFEGMLSLIDLGALTTQRFKAEVSEQENVSTTTTVTFGQVFSPGAYVMFGLGGSPLVLGAGASMAPSLREVSAPVDVGTVSEELSTLRVGGFLAIDVTILPL